MKKRKIVVFTGNRAEYGLQLPILNAISKKSNLNYKLIVSGAHLDKNFGNTLKEIKNDGFKISAEININNNSSKIASNVKAIGSGILSIGKALEKIKPDIMVVYADRFEGFSAVVASTQMNIPTAHIEGGDLTEGGALDDSVRHAMTKLSHIHFTTNEQATNRILAMGEEAWRVHTVGLPAMDLVSKNDFASSDEIVKKYNLELDKPIVLFTQHSITTEYKLGGAQIKHSLNALCELAKKNIQVIITYPNNDIGSDKIIIKLKELNKKKIPNIQIHKSLGRYYYQGFLALAKNRNIKIACVGNSSSGIKETPMFGCPTVNIGTRQHGRLRGNNVIDADYSSNSIIKAIQKCFENKKFRRASFETHNPYYSGNAGDKIAQILSSIPLDNKLLRKKMTIRGNRKYNWFR